MIEDDNRLNNYSKIFVCIYMYVFCEEECVLCYLEMCLFFGMEFYVNILKSDVKIDLSRSVFMKEWIEVMYEGDDLESILK